MTACRAVAVYRRKGLNVFSSSSKCREYSRSPITRFAGRQQQIPDVDGDAGERVPQLSLHRPGGPKVSFEDAVSDWANDVNFGDSFLESRPASDTALEDRRMNSSRYSDCDV